MWVEISIFPFQGQNSINGYHCVYLGENISYACGSNLNDLSKLPCGLQLVIIPYTNNVSKDTCKDKSRIHKTTSKATHTASIEHLIGIVVPFVFITQGAETKSGTPFRFPSSTILLRAASTQVVFPIKQRSCADSQIKIDELTANALLKRSAILLKIKGHLNTFNYFL